MELRFILEHAEATVQSSRKMFDLKDREKSAFMLETLGSWLDSRFVEGILPEPNIDVKPAEPD